MADTRLHVRVKALNTLNAVLRKYGSLFSPQTWSVIFKGEFRVCVCMCVCMYVCMYVCVLSITVVLEHIHTSARMHSERGRYDYYRQI